MRRAVWVTHTVRFAIQVKSYGSSSGKERSRNLKILSLVSKFHTLSADFLELEAYRHITPAGQV